MGALLRSARASLSFCLSLLPPLSSFPTSLAATLRSATNARLQHHLQQRIISVVINGDALGNCYRAARSFLSHRPAIPSAISSLLLQSKYLLLSLYPAILSLSLSHIYIYIHFAPLSPGSFFLPLPTTSFRYETAFQASLNLAPRLPKVCRTRA